MLIRADDLPEVVEPSNDLVMRALVGARDSDNALSVTWVRLSGRHRRLRSDRSTRVYYIIEGAATFAVGGDEPVEARRGDAVVIPRAIPYELWGETEYLV